MWGELALSFQSGNIYIYSMGVLIFFATTIVFERFLMLYFVYSINFPKFIKNLRKMLVSQDYERAMNLCKSVSRTSLPNIALKALEAVEDDPTSVKGTIEEHTIDFLPRLESRLSSIPAIATLIMLLGILATIDGLWSAFHSIDILDTTKKQASLARGISGSLSPSAVGLLAAMLLLACHQFLKSSAIRIIERIHYGVSVLNNILSPQQEFVSVASGSSGPANISRNISDSGITEDENNSETDDLIAADEGVSADEAFDDAVVDDIKDEEEII